MILWFDILKPEGSANGASCLTNLAAHMSAGTCKTPIVNEGHKLICCMPQHPESDHTQNMAELSCSHAGQIVDWRFSGDSTVASAFVSYISRSKPSWNASYWGTLPALKAAKLGHTCPSNGTATKAVGRKLLTISDLS